MGFGMKGAALEEASGTRGETAGQTYGVVAILHEPVWGDVAFGTIEEADDGIEKPIRGPGSGNPIRGPGSGNPIRGPGSGDPVPRKTGDRQDCQRISGKLRRKSMAVLSVPGGFSRVAQAMPARSLE